MLSIISHQEIQIKPRRNQRAVGAGEELGESLLIHCWWERRGVYDYGRQHGDTSATWKQVYQMTQPFHSEIYLNEMKSAFERGELFVLSSLQQLN